MVSGIAMGFIYCLIAIEQSLIWNSCGICNFAHERFITMAAFFFGGLIINNGLTPAQSFLATMGFLILYGILCMPKEEANKVFEYLFDDINKNCFEYTSNNDQSISMLKKITEKFIENADQETVNFIIKNIINYKPRDIIEKCKRCIKAKKQDFSSANYMSFWGDFQHEMLNIIPDKYLNEENMQLKMILDRKFSIRKYSIYDMGRLKMRDVISPIANKKISLKNWLDILTDKTITNKHSTKY